MEHLILSFVIRFASVHYTISVFLSRVQSSTDWILPDHWIVMKLLGFVIIVLGVCYVDSRRSVTFVGRRVDCKEFNKEYLYDLTCGIKLISRDKQTYSVHMYIKPVVVHNIHVRYTLVKHLAYIHPRLFHPLLYNCCLQGSHEIVL